MTIPPGHFPPQKDKGMLKYNSVKRVDALEELVNNKQSLRIENSNFNSDKNQTNFKFTIKNYESFYTHLYYKSSN